MPQPHTRRFQENATPKYIHVEDESVVVAITQRAASTSMNKALFPKGKKHQGVQLVKPNEAEALKDSGAEVVLWLRDWRDRFASMYRLFHRSTETSEQFLIKTLRHEPNIHWMPQVALHTVNGVFLPTTVHKFDDIQTTWNNRFALAPGRSLPTPMLPQRPRVAWNTLKSEFTPAQRTEIEDFYAVDEALYASLP